MLKMGITEDPRDKLDRLRRSDLKKIVLAHKIPIDIDAPAETLRVVIRNAMESNKIKLRIRDNINPTMDKSAIVDIPKQKPMNRYEGQSRFDLMRIAKERNIHVSRSDSRETIVEKLNG